MRRFLVFLISAILTCAACADPLPEGTSAAPAAPPAQTSAASGAQGASPAEAAKTVPETAKPAPAASGTPAPGSQAAPGTVSAKKTPNFKVDFDKKGAKRPAAPAAPKRADSIEAMPPAEHIIMLDASSRMAEAGYGSMQSGFKGAPMLFANVLKPHKKYLRKNDPVTIIPFSNLQDDAINGHNAISGLKLKDFSHILSTNTVKGPGPGELKDGLIKPLGHAIRSTKRGVRFFWIFTKQDLNLKDPKNYAFFRALRDDFNVGAVWYAPLKVMPGAKEEACLYLIAVNVAPEKSPWLIGFMDAVNDGLGRAVPGSRFIRLKTFAQPPKTKRQSAAIALMPSSFRTDNGNGFEAPLMKGKSMILDMKPEGSRWKATLDFDVYYPEGWQFAPGALTVKAGNGHTVAKNKKDSRLVKVDAQQTATGPDETGKIHVHWDLFISDNSVKNKLLNLPTEKAVDVKVSLKDTNSYEYGEGANKFAPLKEFRDIQGFEDVAKLMIYDADGNASYSLTSRPISLRLSLNDSHSASSMLVLGGGVLVAVSVIGMIISSKKDKENAGKNSSAAPAVQSGASGQTGGEPESGEAGAENVAPDASSDSAAEAGAGNAGEESAAADALASDDSAGGASEGSESQASSEEPAAEPEDKPE